MQNVSIAEDVIIELEVDSKDVVIDIGLDQAEVELTEAQQTLFRGESGSILSLDFEENDWERLSVDSYRLTIPKATHKFNSPYICEMFLIDEEGAENNLRPTYRVSANDNIIIFSNIPIDCKIKIGGEK